MLLGGGHAHVIVIKKWAMNPVPDVRVTLVSDAALTPYSGMLPGLIAGHYNVEESHIDLVRLCAWAGIRFVEDTAVGLDPEKQEIVFATRPSVGYDILSIDTGGAPNLDVVEGAASHATAVKPVYRFYDKWRQIEIRAKQSAAPLNIGVVGAGAGGFEILLAMHHRMLQLYPDTKHQFHWFVRGEILDGYPRRVQTQALETVQSRNIQCHRDFDVMRVRADGLESSAGAMISLDEVLWCTEAKAPDWPQQSGLQCDEKGFILLRDSLQSVSHTNVFAAGDVAVQVNHYRPRAGVFAVRQGPPLYENLRRAALHQPLKIHRPQNRFLTILSTGRKHAIASRGGLSVAGNWVWQWKDWIDQRFMHRFNRLPVMRKNRLGKIADAYHNDSGDASAVAMRCGGCGAKVPDYVLRSVLQNVGTNQNADQVLGHQHGNDVAIIKPRDQYLVQSVDQIRSMISDPWVFSRIATLHALSDLYTTRAVPHSALVVAGVPYADASLVQRELTQLMSGVTFELNRAGCVLSGGHTSESAELTLGLTVNGYLERFHPESGASGQSILLTKSLGIGVVMAAHMRGAATGPVVNDAIEQMLVSNASASEILWQYGATAMTDVTGFGLGGHLIRLLEQLQLGAELTMESLPVMQGVMSLLERGFKSSLFDGNRMIEEKIGFIGGSMPGLKHSMLFDPQTNGGLVALIDNSQISDCLTALTQAGVQGTIIGEVTEQQPMPLLLR